MRYLLIFLLILPFSSMAQQHVLIKDSTTIDSFRLTMWMRQLIPPSVPKINRFFDSTGSVYLASDGTWYRHNGTSWVAIGGGGGGTYYAGNWFTLTGSTFNFDSTNRVDYTFSSPTSLKLVPSSVLNTQLGYVYSALSDTAAAIRGDFPAAFDSTHIYAALADSMATARDSIAALRAAIPNVSGFALQASLVDSMQDVRDSLANHWIAITGKQPQLNGTGFVVAAGTAISYDNNTYYLASNPNGYTSNTGTVTSIALANGYGLGISGSPVTGAGTITATVDTAELATRLRVQKGLDSVAALSGGGSVATVYTITVTSNAGTVTATNSKEQTLTMTAGATADTLTFAGFTNTVAGAGGHHNSVAITIVQGATPNTGGLYLKGSNFGVQYNGGRMPFIGTSTATGDASIIIYAYYNLQTGKTVVEYNSDNRTPSP